jgi:hypothetical protein
MKIKLVLEFLFYLILGFGGILFFLNLNLKHNNKIYGFSCYDGGRIILSSTGSLYDHSERSIIEDNSKLKLYLPSNCIVVEN